MNIFKKTKIRQKGGNILYYLIMGMVLFVGVIAFVNASMPTLAEQLNKEKVMALDYQTELKSHADGIRSELSVLEPRVAELHAELQDTKEEWQRQSGKIEAIEVTLGLVQEK